MTSDPETAHVQALLRHLDAQLDMATEHVKLHILSSQTLYEIREVIDDLALRAGLWPAPRTVSRSE